MAVPDDDVFFATIGELSARLKAKEFSAVELTRAFAARLEKLGPRYNALALSLSEDAIKKAKDLDGDIKRDRWRGPLQAIPFGAKDLLAVKGQPTTWGAKPYAGQVFDFDATALKKLEKSGALLIGKLSMVELAGGGGYRYAAASLQGPGINPWNRGRWSGGSSSGSGAAVAAGLVTYALGSETSGSIVTPASYCGVTGLRPTYGLVSRHGAMALSWTLDKIGPMCRSAEDCGLVLQAISGGDSNDPGSAGKSFYYAPQFARKPAEIKVGYAPVDFVEWADPAMRPAFEQALAAFKEIGVQLVETKLPELPYGPTIGTIISAEGSSIFEPLIQSGKVNDLADAKQIAGLKAGLEIPAKDYLKAMRIRSIVQQEFRKLFIDVDVLLAPARYTVASKLEDPLDRRAADRPAPGNRGMSALIPAGNLAGLPALTLPCGFAGDLPVALQLVSRPFTENLILALGKEYQGRTDWHRRRPKT
jgi:aspartyl-tRNA(Asn)/glutamyl-tRNA(Gln) amidotransferase subunit A